MATFEEGFFQVVAAHAGLRALVAGRIYRTVAPLSVTKPYLTFMTVFSESGRVEEGLSGMSERLVQVNCFAETAAEVQNIAEQLRLCLAAYNDVMGSTGFIMSVMSYRRRAEYREPDTGLFSLPCDISLMHGEATT